MRRQLSFRCACSQIAIPLTLGAQGNNQAGTGDTEDKRILGIFTNHRTTDESMNRAKLTPGGKFDIAWHDATDRAIFVQSAILSGIGQLPMGILPTGRE